jgi:protein tyrosine phosphatase (PTP) superfamily phosphohydrolase (DUF442 family)
MKKSFLRIAGGISVGFFLLLFLFFILKSSGFLQHTCFSQYISLVTEDKASAGAVDVEQNNFHVVKPGIWRSAQPSEDSLKRMKMNGLKTIVNLRADDSNNVKEKKIAEKLGLQYYYFPMKAEQDQDLNLIDRILAVIERPAEQPLLVHCIGGRDRTGMIIAIYKIEHTDQKFEDIYKEMLMFGYNQKGLPAVMRTIRHWCEVHGRPDIVSKIRPDGSGVVGLPNGFN